MKKDTARDSHLPREMFQSASWSTSLFVQPKLRSSSRNSVRNPARGRAGRRLSSQHTAARLSIEHDSCIAVSEADQSRYAWHRRDCDPIHICHRPDTREIGLYPVLLAGNHNLPGRSIDLSRILTYLSRPPLPFSPAAHSFRVLCWSEGLLDRQSMAMGRERKRKEKNKKYNIPISLADGTARPCKSADRARAVNCCAFTTRLSTRHMYGGDVVKPPRCCDGHHAHWSADARFIWVFKLHEHMRAFGIN